MTNKRRDRQIPNIEHIVSLFDDSPISLVVMGNQIVEAMLVQLIDLKLTHPNAFDAFELRFPQKVSMCKALDLIEDNLAQFLLELHALRNKLAHQLGYECDFEMAFQLVQKAAGAGIEFPDARVHLDRVYSENRYGARGILEEVFRNLARDLAYTMHDNGGELFLY